MKASLSRLTVADVSQWKELMLSSGLMRNTVAFYLRTAKAAYNHAVLTGAVAEPRRHPWRGISCANEKTRKRALSSEQLLRLEQLPTDGYQQSHARDAFLLSLYLRGMPPVDLFKLTRADLQTGFVSYRRSKTGQAIRVKVEGEVKELTARLGRDGRRLLRMRPSAVNRHLKQIGAQIGAPGLTLYWARHTWASLARSMGVPLHIISAGLGHTSLQMTQTYLSEIDCGEIDEYNCRMFNKLHQQQ